MSDTAQVALISAGLSALSLIAQLLNALMQSKLRADLAELKTELMDRSDARYQSRETFATELKRIEELVKRAAPS